MKYKIPLQITYTDEDFQFGNDGFPKDFHRIINWLEENVEYFEIEVCYYDDKGLIDFDGEHYVFFDNDEDAFKFILECM